ncbi:MAG: DUF2975 domain-containing protein [Candidatus Latescibacteria bacterium]|nr:DUF2975 domain-containing protein [Candidatus Latescibacterota bacterium]
MKIIEDNKTYKVLKIISDVLITVVALGVVISIITAIIHYRITGSMENALDSSSGFVVNVFRVIITPVSLGLFLLILFQLRKIFILISGDSPFEMQNIDRVRSIGYAVFLLGFIKFATFLVHLIFSENSRFIFVNGPMILLGFGQLMFAGFVVFVIAEIFRIGFEIYNEQKLTV